MSFPDLLAPPVRRETTHRAELELGPVIVDGVVRWASQSLITLADPNQVGGCQRRFWYKYVDNRPDVQTKAKDTGTNKLHAPIERYLKFGDRSLLNDIVLAGMRYIPDPGPDLLVEFPICYKRDDGSIHTLLHAAGVPIAGHIDLIDPRRAFIRDDGEVLFDPQNTIEIHDWKSTSSIEKYAKSGHELGSTIQMPLYAKAMSEMSDGYAEGLIAWMAAQPTPDAVQKSQQMRTAIGHLPRIMEWFRLSQTFFGTKKRESSKSTLLLRKVDVEKRWTSIENKVRGILGLAKASCADDVPGNPLACRLYPPEGCPYQSVCSVGSGNSLASVFGQAGADALLGKPEGGNHVMSLLDALNPTVTIAPAPVVAAAVTLPVPTAPAAIDPVAAARAALAKAEADAEAARLAAQPAPVVAAPLPPSPVTDALDVIARAGQGSPTVVGPLAVLVSTARGAFSQADIAGTGPLARMAIHNADQLIQFAKLTPGQIAQVAQLPDAQLKQLAAELAAAAGAQPWDESQRQPPVPQPINILPTDVPVSNPTLAALPLPAETVAPAVVVTPSVLVPQPIPAPVQTPALPGVGGQTSPATPPAAKKRGRKSNAEKAAERVAAQAAAGVTPTTPAVGALPAPVTTAQPDADESDFEAAVDGMMILVVGVVPSVAADSLAPWVDQMAKNLCERFNVRDVRIAPEGSPLAFGKWKGAIAAYARELVETGVMPRGIYYADGADEITNEVINGLRPLCHFFARQPGR